MTTPPKSNTTSAAGTVSSAPHDLEGGRDARSELAFVLDSMPDGVLGIDRRGVIVSANAAAARLLGHASGELVGRPLSRFVARERDAEEIAVQFRTEGELHSEEIEVTRAGGRRGWLSISASARPDGALVFVRDVTERHEAREQLEAKNEELESYVRNVSHDLRSPLVSLLGFTGLLRSDYAADLPPTALHFLDRIEQAGRNMERLLHDLLEHSRIGATPQCRVQVNPLPVLEQIAAELKLRLDDKGIGLHLPSRSPTLLCDRTGLYQIFSNLLGNAINHLPADSTGSIDVRIEETDGGCQITVADNGPGIPHSDRERIFEMFQTARRPGQPKTGSGLGLSIVRKIVAAHHGRVRVEGEPGEGARFVVWLPNG